MRVSSWKTGKSEVDIDCPFGLNLGKKNREFYFSGLTEAKVKIEDEVYVFSLARVNFWTTCPELRDKDVIGGGTPIRDILQRLDSLTWTRRRPRHFDLEARGGGEFILS